MKEDNTRETVREFPEKKLKICLVSKGLPRIPPESGIPVTIYVHTLAQQFAQLGHSVDVICAPTPNKQEQLYNIIEVGRPRLSSNNAYIQNLYELWFSFCCGLALRKLCRQNKYDVINFFENPATAFSALLLAKSDMPPFLFSTGRPVSVKELTWESQDSPLPIRLASNAMHSHVFKRITGITTSSNRLKEVVVRQVKINPARIMVAPFISAETDLFHPDVDGSDLRQELQLPGDDPVVLCLAPVAPYKNQLSLVKAIPRIIQKHPNTRFLFAGEIIKHYHSQIQQFIQSHNLNKHVIFTGFIKRYSDLPKYYSLADVYVLLSRAEGNLPKTILEAMSCGKAVLASSIPQNREGAKRGDEVMFVDPYDIDAIADALNRLLDDPELRARLGNSARRTIMEHYAPEVVARGLIMVYKEVISGRKAAKRLPAI